MSNQFVIAKSNVFTDNYFIFYETIIKDYFLKILKNLRSDDKPNSVSSGFGVDKLAPIRDILNSFLHFAERIIRAIFR